MGRRSHECGTVCRSGRRPPPLAGPLSHCLSVAALSALVWLSGCAPRGAPHPSATPFGTLPAAQQLFDALAERRSTVRAVRAMARLSYTSPDESRKAKQLLVVERPDRLRFEILSPFGAVFVLTASGGALAAWTRDNSTVYRGTASAENLQRYTEVDLPVATAVDLLLGTPPMQSDPSTVVSADGDAIELWQERGRTVRVAWFTPALDPLRYEERDTDGRVRVRTTFGQYADIGGGRVPTQLGIELPGQQRRIDIVLTDTEVNPMLPDAVFALETPPGSREVDLDRIAQ